MQRMGGGLLMRCNVELRKLELALVDVEQSFKQLEFAIKLMCYCENGYMNNENFDSDVTLLLDEENVNYPAGTFGTFGDIMLSAQIMVSVSFGVSAITLDSAYEAASISSNPESSDSHDELRSLIYMVRCAYAHNIAAPLWEVRGKNLKNVELDLEGERVSLDLKDLHGKQFEYSHIGGFSNWLKIRRLAVNHLEKYLGKEKCQPIGVSED